MYCFWIHWIQTDRHKFIFIYIDLADSVDIGHLQHQPAYQYYKPAILHDLKFVWILPLFICCSHIAYWFSGSCYQANMKTWSKPESGSRIWVKSENAPNIILKDYIELWIFAVCIFELLFLTVVSVKSTQFSLHVTMA